MAKTYLNEENMRDIIWGATLMGGGGGGSISSGMMLLDSYKKDHPDETLSVEMIDAGDMPKGTYAAATAGMGAPAAIAGVDFSAWAANAFAVLRDLAARDGKKLGYNYPVELGGFSTFFPLLLSLKTGLPTVDCDGAGRAVPALETLLLNVNDCPMEQSCTQQEFVAYMNAYGYDVKWEPHQKYTTYTTPENIRCRDSKLFDQTLKRENMELYFRLGGADYLQACREIAYDHREPTPTLEDAVCDMAGTVAAICALCEDEDSEVSDLARELYYSSLLLQELVEWYQSRRQEQENYEEEYEQYHGFDMTMM